MLKTLKDFGGMTLAAADVVAFVLRRASRAVRVGLRTLLRQPLGLSALPLAAASAAYARKPHCPPRAWGLVAMETITGSGALLTATFPDSQHSDPLICSFDVEVQRSAKREAIWPSAGQVRLNGEEPYLLSAAIVQPC